MTRLAPRIRIHPDGTATLSGIPHRDLTSILTAASLNHYETEQDLAVRRKKKLAEDLAEYENDPLTQNVIRRNHRDSEIWAARIRHTLNLAETSLKDRYHYKAEYLHKPVSQLTEWEKKRRLEAIKDKKEFRARMGELFVEIQAERAEALASDKG